MSQKISRRGMISLGAASMAVAAMPASAHDPCKLPQKWDVTTEVLVIGSRGWPPRFPPPRAARRRW